MFSGGPKWAIILPVTISLVVIVVLAMVYFLKLYKTCYYHCLLWCDVDKKMQEKEEWKNRDNMVIAHTSQIGSDNGKSMARSQGGEYIAPLAIDNRKKPEYIRGTSNNSTDVS